MIKAVFLLFLAQGIFSIAHGCGKYEFYMWEDLPLSVQKAAMKLDYDEESWLFVGTNAIEQVALSDLINGITLQLSNGEEKEVKFGSEELEAFKELDLYHDEETIDDPELCWDHFVNHYMGYTWDEINAPLINPFGNDLSEGVKILGWTKEMWDSSDTNGGRIPESDCKDWFDLSPDEQWALQSMGWSGMKWMNYPLGESST